MIRNARAIFRGKWVNRLILALYFCAFAAILGMLLYKCPYGYGAMDESFYLSIVHRLLQGDRLLVEEAHLSQFAFLTMVPEMWIYSKFVPSMEGIVLNFRYLYTILWSAACLFLFFRTRNIHRYAAMCASLFLLLFAPYGIMAFSYNSLGIMYQINSVVFLLCAGRRQKIQFALSGGFFAGAVLCCPYLAVVYFLFSAGVLVLRWRRRSVRILCTGADAFFCWRYFTFGVCGLAIPVMILLLARSTQGMIWDALQFALTDPEHKNFSFLGKTEIYFSALASSNAYFMPMLVILIIMTVLTLYKKKVTWFVIVCAAVTLYLRRFMAEGGYLNYLMLPLTFTGIYVLLVTKSRQIRQIGLLWLVPGILYTFCLNYSSDQGFYAISLASSVPSAASIYMIWLYCDELKQAYQEMKIPESLFQKKDAPEIKTDGQKTPKERTVQSRIRNLQKILIYPLACLTVCVLFGFQMKYEIPVRYRSVYWEEGLMERKLPRIELTEGPEKGIVCSREPAERYKQNYADVRNICHQRVLFLSQEFWMPLINENENAGFSAWLGLLIDDGDSIMERLKLYYQRNPHKTPEMIFLESVYIHLLPYFSEEDYQIDRLSSGSYVMTPRKRMDLFEKKQD